MLNAPISGPLHVAFGHLGTIYDDLTLYVHSWTVVRVTSTTVTEYKSCFIRGPCFCSKTGIREVTGDGRPGGDEHRTRELRLRTIMD